MIKIKKRIITIYISNKKIYFLNKEKNFYVIKQKESLFKDNYLKEEKFEKTIINLFLEHKIKNQLFNLKIIVYIDFLNSININIIKEVFQKHFFNKIIIKRMNILKSYKFKIFITKGYLIVINNKIKKTLNFNIFLDKKDILKGLISYINYVSDYFQTNPILYGDSIYIKKIAKTNSKFLYIEDFDTLIKEKLLKSI